MSRTKQRILKAILLPCAVQLTACGVLNNAAVPLASGGDEAPGSLYKQLQMLLSTVSEGQRQQWLAESAAMPVADFFANATAVVSNLPTVLDGSAKQRLEALAAQYPTMGRFWQTLGTASSVANEAEFSASLSDLERYSTSASSAAGQLGLTDNTHWTTRANSMLETGHNLLQGVNKVCGAVQSLLDLSLRAKQTQLQRSELNVQLAKNDLEIARTRLAIQRVNAQAALCTVGAPVINPAAGQGRWDETLEQLQESTPSLDGFESD